MDSKTELFDKCTNLEKLKNEVLTKRQLLELTRSRDDDVKKAARAKKSEKRKEQPLKKKKKN